MTKPPLSLPEPRVDPAGRYRSQAVPRPGVLRLDANEGSRPTLAMLNSTLRGSSDALRTYPETGNLESALAARFRVSSDRVVLGAGADDIIDRCCRAYLDPGTNIVLPVPTFEMLERYVELAGAHAVRVPWITSAFPLADVCAAIDEDTRAVAVVSPNNPTGAVISRDELRSLAIAATGKLVMLDQAYVEYAADDISDVALELCNVVVIRTFSKAWGLAGCRVGYAIASREVTSAIRAAGAPYPVAAPSASIARSALHEGDDRTYNHVRKVRSERAALSARLRRAGLSPFQSEANFVLVDCGSRAEFMHSALAALGVLVRSFPSRAALTNALRISLPGDDRDFAMLMGALDTIFEPEALLFDLDGVLADVSESYRRCVIEVAREFDVDISPEEVAHAKLADNANNDWAVTQSLLRARGIEPPIEDIVKRFQRIYIGNESQPGLRDRERLITSRDVLQRLAARYAMAVVTGRPREEAEWFLERYEIRAVFRAVVCLEDAPPKPNPEPVRRALVQLEVERAWMLGDTPDDVGASIAAGVVPIGITPPGANGQALALLKSAGAAAVINTFEELEDLLP